MERITHENPEIRNFEVSARADKGAARANYSLEGTTRMNKRGRSGDHLSRKIHSNGYGTARAKLKLLAGLFSTQSKE